MQISGTVDRYTGPLAELERLISGSICFHTNRPGIETEYKPQQPQMLDSLLSHAGTRVDVSRKYDGWTVYLTCEAGGVWILVRTRQHGYRFRFKLEGDLHPLYLSLNMTAVGELIAVDASGNDLGYEAVEKVLRMYLGGVAKSIDIRLEIRLFDIVRMADMNRSAFHPYVPRIIGLMVSVGGPLVKAAEVEHYRVHAGLFFPPGSDAGLDCLQMKEHCLAKALRNRWEGVVVCCPHRLEGLGPSDVAYLRDWSDTVRDLSQAKCKQMFELVVMVANFIVLRKSGLENVFVFYANVDSVKVKPVLEIWADEHKLMSPEARRLFRGLAVPDHHRANKSLDQARAYEFSNAYSRLHDRHENACMAKLVFSWMTESGHIKGLKQISEVYPDVDVEKLTHLPRMLLGVSHRVRVLKNRADADFAALPSVSHLNKADVHELDLEDQEPAVAVPKKKRGKVAYVPQPPKAPEPVRPQAEPVRPQAEPAIPQAEPEIPKAVPAIPKAEPQPCPPPQPDPIHTMLFSAPRKLPYRQGDSWPLIRLVYFMLFRLCSVIVRNGEGKEKLMEARQTVADHVNCIDLFFRPDVLIFLLDYLDWSRFLERDMQTGYYHPLPIEENVSAEEVGRILKKGLMIPSIMTQLTDPRLHSDEGLAELHKWFDRFAAPDIQTEEEFEAMDEKYMEHFRRFPQINWAPKRQTPPVPVGPMVRRPPPPSQNKQMFGWKAR